MISTLAKIALKGIWEGKMVTYKPTVPFVSQFSTHASFVHSAVANQALQVMANAGITCIPRKLMVEIFHDDVETGK